MDLSAFPRRHYLHGPTPIEPLDRLSEALGGPRIWAKRDDLLGIGGGGNKTRKLEFLIADAIASGATGIITCGAVQSNHCRLTAAAAAREGLECHLVLEERVPDSYDREASGNNFLFHLLGVTSIAVVPGGTDVAEEMDRLHRQHEAAGGRSYVIPGGGSNALGALGYVRCADEIVHQSFDEGVAFNAVVCASGSGGTHAGLLAGLLPQGGPRVEGISVRYSTEIQTERIHQLLMDTLACLDARIPVTTTDVIVHDGFVGEGYSLPTDGMIEAVRLVARTEAILLDPVYTGKAMAGLIGLIREGRFASSDQVLFVHTGGAPALFAYEAVLDSGRAGS